MRRMMITSSLLLAISASAMASQVYKWVDAQGVTHFSAQPPQGQEATSVNTAAPPPRPAVAEEKKAAPTFDSIADPEQAAIDEKVKQEVALTIYTFTRTENAENAEGMLRSEVARFHADGITEEELEDAVTNLSGSEAFRNQAPWSPMGTRMWELRHGLPAGTYERVMAETQALTLEQVNAFIARFYDPAAFTMVKVVPK